IFFFQLIALCLKVLLTASVAIEQSSDIKEDVINIANQTQKVIRVHPQDLPSKKDSSGSQINSALFQIQTLRPGSASIAGFGSTTESDQRQYVDSKQMRKRRPRPAKLQDVAASGEDAMQPALKYPLKAFPKQKLKQEKQLNFNTKGNGVSVEKVTQVLPIKMTAGPYPLYYVVSKTNGRFGKFSIKAFSSPEEFSKYLIKSKGEPISQNQRFEVIL
ncbi:hypothetical protein KR009_004692, partial [Drosophila setifemur]